MFCSSMYLLMWCNYWYVLRLVRLSAYVTVFTQYRLFSVCNKLVFSCNLRQFRFLSPVQTHSLLIFPSGWTNSVVVPTIHTSTKIHRKHRSMTMATNFQSFSLCMINSSSLTLRAILSIDSIALWIYSNRCFSKLIVPWNDSQDMYPTVTLNLAFVLFVSRLAHSLVWP